MHAAASMLLRLLACHPARERLDGVVRGRPGGNATADFIGGLDGSENYVWEQQGGGRTSLNGLKAAIICLVDAFLVVDIVYMWIVYMGVGEQSCSLNRAQEFKCFSSGGSGAEGRIDVGS